MTGSLPAADAAAAARQWRDHVRPDPWPEPASGTFDLVVIGGGTAGLVTAMGAAGLGARVALVERHRLGGDCLNTGCVPSKALLASARAVRAVNRAPRVGVAVDPARPDFRAIMGRMRALRAGLSRHDAATRLTAAGVQVMFGEGRFTGPRTLRVGEATLRFRRAVLATGTRPVVPPVPGLVACAPLTSETVFDLEACPARLLVVGAGPIGCELAQAFAAFGSRVTLLDVADRVLPREDPDASAILGRRLAEDGITVVTGAQLVRAEAGPGPGGATVTWQRGACEETWRGDRLLVAAGRAAHLDTLGLAAAGIRVESGRLVVTPRLQTTNPRVFAAGDIASPWPFTHAADATARLVVQNALVYGRRSVGALVMPWCTYTTPEVAHVGVSAAEAARDGLGTVTVSLADVDRAVLDDEADGFVRLHHRKGRVLGATVVAPHAGELVALVAHHIRHRGTMGDLAALMTPYPTYADALRRAGDAWRRTRLTPRVRRALSAYLSVWRRL